MVCRRVLVLCFALLLAVACVTAAPPPPPPPAPPPPAELDTNAVCAIVVEVEDAVASGTLVALRHRYQLRANEQREAAFGMLLAEPTAEARFKAFHDELSAQPDSIVGPLGECLVYGGWSRMKDQAARTCAAVMPKLRESAPLATLGLAQSALTHDGDRDGALALIEEGRKAAPDCKAFSLLKARALAAGATPDEARAAWRTAVTALPSSFTVLSEAAAAEERADPSVVGRAAAATLWERALALAPDHPETLRRFAAVTAGVDDARAFKAYLAAVDAGAKDYPTVLAAARLSSLLATTPDAQTQALALAKRAIDASRDDPEPRRLQVSVLSRLGKHDDVMVAANALLDLVPDDVIAHVALARAAAANGPLSKAVVHYDAAAAAVAAGASLDAADAAALQAERQGLLDRLLVKDVLAPASTANAVAGATQKALQVLWRERIKKKAANKGGALVVVAETDADGRVISVDVKTDTVGDDDIAAATVAQLSRATVKGGARRYTMEFTLR